MAEHKWADVLRAIADKGFEAVQFWPVGGQVNKWCVATAAVNPLTHPELEWRIKPEPKPYVVVHGKAVREKADCKGMRTAFYSFAAQHDAEDNLRLVFDGETGKLKSAEVLP